MMMAKFAVLLSVAVLAALASASNENTASLTDSFAEIDQLDSTGQHASAQQAQQSSKQQGWGNRRNLAILKEYGMAVLLAIVLTVLHIAASRRAPAALQVRLPAQLHTTG